MSPKSESEISEQYNSMNEVWDKSDHWHTITNKTIDKYIKKQIKYLNINTAQILNAGSAGNNYCLPSDNVTHIDLAGSKINNCKKAIVGSIEKIPPIDCYFDLILCVGSVINYCDPVKVLNEFNKVINTDGRLILEFENSFTLELLGKKQFNKKATLMNTFYNHKPERIWYFSEKFIREILTEMKFEILNIKRYHILSPLVYRITQNENASSFFSKFDPILKYIPILNKFSSNIILTARKFVKEK